MATTQFKLKKRMHEVYFVEPNDLGIGLLTSIYKILTAPLKTIPLVLVIPLSVMSGIILYLLLNQLIVNLTTLLQYGF